jgi:hypothetical protein
LNPEPVVTSGIDVDAQERSPMGLETNLHRRANGVRDSA